MSGSWKVTGCNFSGEPHVASWQQVRMTLDALKLTADSALQNFSMAAWNLHYSCTGNKRLGKAFYYASRQAIVLGWLWVFLDGKRFLAHKYYFLCNDFSGFFLLNLTRVASFLLQVQFSHVPVTVLVSTMLSNFTTCFLEWHCSMTPQKQLSIIPILNCRVLLRIKLSKSKQNEQIKIPMEWRDICLLCNFPQLWQK